MGGNKQIVLTTHGVGTRHKICNRTCSRYLIMKKIYYCIVEEVEVPDDMTDEEIDQLICNKLDSPKDYMQSDQDDLLGAVPKW